jgi:SEC-C motif-containing protein
MNPEICPCGSGSPFVDCCSPYMSGEKNAPTAEALMRARYSAFVKGNIAFIKSTLARESQKDFDEESVRQWSKKSDWLGLEVIRTEGGGKGDTKGMVEFNARYKLNGKIVGHHEVSQFRKEKLDGRWYFVDGESHEHQDGDGHHHHPSQPVIRAAPKIGRNDPCNCGSGKKFKKCHGA